MPLWGQVVTRLVKDGYGAKTIKNYFGVIKMIVSPYTIENTDVSLERRLKDGQTHTDDSTKIL
jgi:hypothetical protein